MAEEDIPEGFATAAADAARRAVGSAVDPKPVPRKAAVDVRDPDTRQQYDEMPQSEKEAFSGVAGTQRLNGDVPFYIKTAAERVIDKGNCFYSIRCRSRFRPRFGLWRTRKYALCRN